MRKINNSFSRHLFAARFDSEVRYQGFKVDYQTAKRAVLTKRIAGAVLAIISLTFVLMGLLLFLYNSLGVAEGQVLASLSLAIKNLVYGIFANTQLLLPIWNNAPVPNPGDITSMGTLGFLGWYMGAFVGASLVASANKLARRLRAIDEQIENETISDSLRGSRRRSRAELEQKITVSSQSVWQQFHTLYIAPLVVGIVLWLIAKAIG